MKRPFVFIILLLCIPITGFSQSRIKAAHIIEQINKGVPVTFENTEIIGDLDFLNVRLEPI